VSVDQNFNVRDKLTIRILKKDLFKVKSMRPYYLNEPKSKLSTDVKRQLSNDTAS
jgi:hypothetical protein